jgi:hypothetical protein
MEKPVCCTFSVSFIPTDHKSDDVDENDLPGDTEDEISQEYYANSEDGEGAKHFAFL